MINSIYSKNCMIKDSAFESQRELIQLPIKTINDKDTEKLLTNNI